METRTRRQVNMARLLLRAFRWFEDSLFVLLDEAGWPGIGRPHSAVFAHLDREGTRESELARRIGVTRQTVHQAVQELRGMGLVELAPDPSNRSAKLVMVTDRGRRHSRAALQAFAKLEEELARRIGERQAADLRRILEFDWGPPIGGEESLAHLKKP